MFKKKMNISGYVDQDYQSVRDVFERNFLEKEELGASCVVYQDGKKVVDLYGGWQDLKRTNPWTPETYTLVFSASKGIISLAMALLHSEGRLDFEEKVATYWPEFAQAGKEGITVRQLLSHEAGLSTLDRVLSVSDLKDKEHLAEILGRQKPDEIGKSAYHAQTIGWYLSELCHRVDPKKRYLTQFLQEEISQPLGLQFYLGYPIQESVSELKDFNAFTFFLDRKQIIWSFGLSILLPWSKTTHAMKNPPIKRPKQMQDYPWRDLEMPASNGYATADGLAKTYQALATADFFPRIKPETKLALYQPKTPSFDKVLHAMVSIQLGFMHASEKWAFGSDDRALGFSGLGGSFAFADPATKMSYAYIPNRLGCALWNDPREKELRQAALQAAGRGRIL